VKAGFRVALVLITAAVLYRGLFVQLRVFDVIANVMLLCAIAAGIAGGPDRGAIVGFFAGITYDLMLPTSPVGLNALTFCLVGFVVGRYQGTVVRSAMWVTMAIAGLASAGGMLLYIGIGQLVNRENFLNRPLWSIIAVIAVVNALLAPLAVRVMRWALDISSRELRPLLR
jgi:rod shape-determining protein MreD